MRFTVMTYGSEGECRPLAELCAGLAAAGHDVVLFADASASAYTQGRAFDFVALGGDMAAAIRAVASSLSCRTYGGAIVRIVADLMRKHGGEWLRVLVDRSRGADAIVCGGMGTFIGISCAEALGIPVVVTSLQPMRPTREFPTPLMPSRRLPASLNRLTHHAALGAFRLYFRRATNDARREGAGLPPRYPSWSGYSMIMGVSPTLVPKPKDWSADSHVVGYWWPPQEPAWQPDAELAAFLAQGEPPVYVGFGSMVLPERERLQSIVLDALDGRRALLARGWGEWNASVPRNVHVIHATPHAWLFPRVSVAVHHGGTGTVHAAARAGTPSVVVSFMADQSFWGDRLHRLGIGARPVALHRLNARRLREALRAAGTSDVAETARRVAQSMRHDEGVGRAVTLIEHAAVTGGPPR